MFKLKCNFTSGFSGANNVCRMAEKNLKKFRRAIKFFITIFRFHLQNFVVDSFHFSLYYFYYADVVIHNIFFLLHRTLSINFLSDCSFHSFHVRSNCNVLS